MKIRLLVARGTALLAIFLMWSPLAVAQQEHNPRDLALLPRFCFATYSFRHLAQPGEEAHYKQLLGVGVMHLHHYCWGLQHTNRALLFDKTKTERMRSLHHSVREFDYTIRKVDSTFKLLPEILTKKGENLIRLEQGPAAVIVLERATELKADYWPAYVALSDYYRRSGNTQKAREWLDKGLASAPDSKALRSRSAELAAGNGKAQTPQKPATEAAKSDARAARSEAPEADATVLQGTPR